MSSVPLVCDKCHHTWSYGGKALNNPSSRVHCPKCNSTRIMDTLGNKVNLGFKRIKRSTSPLYSKTSTQPQQQQFVGLDQHTPPTQVSNTGTILQPTTGLDLSDAKKMLGQPIPSVQQFKGQIQQQQPTPGQILQQPQVIPGVQPYQVPAFTGDDFKIIYMLIDDFNEWTTKNKGVRHTLQRNREMGTLLARMFNKYGVNFALEVTFLISHIAFMSPILFHYYKGTRKGKSKTEEDTPQATKESAPTPPDDAKKPESAPIKAKTVSPHKTMPFSSIAFRKGKPKTIKDYMR